MKQAANDTINLFFWRAGVVTFAITCYLPLNCITNLFSLFFLFFVHRQDELGGKCQNIQGIANFKQGFIWQKKEKPHFEDFGLEGLMHIKWIIAQSVQ